LFSFGESKRDFIAQTSRDGAEFSLRNPARQNAARRKSRVTSLGNTGGGVTSRFLGGGLHCASTISLGEEVPHLRRSAFFFLVFQRLRAGLTYTAPTALVVANGDTIHFKNIAKK
jgi:hypothetical protein